MTDLDVQNTLTKVGLGQFFEVTATGLQIKGEPTFMHCEQLWETFITVHHTIQIAMGDAMRYFKQRFGDDKASQIITERTGWSLETARNYEWVAEKVPKEVRRFDKLTFAHHQKVAHCQPREQKAWLDRAADSEDHPWTAARLDAAVKQNADHPITEWVLVAFFETERARDEAKSRLEGRGVKCKASERRTTREQEQET